MTDVPALLMTTLALIVHLRGLQQKRVWLVIVGAALLGAGVNLRETVAFYGPWLLFAPFVCGWRLNRKNLLLVVLSGLVFVISAGSGFAYWFLSDPNYRAAWFGWRESMRVESALHPPAIRNLWPWLLFFLATSPLVLLTLPLAFVWEWRAGQFSPVLVLAAGGYCRQFAVAAELQHSHWLALPFDRTPGFSASMFEFSVSVFVEAFGNGATRVHHRSCGDRPDWFCYGSVLVAVANRDDGSKSGSGKNMTRNW